MGAWSYRWIRRNWSTIDYTLLQNVLSTAGASSTGGNGGNGGSGSTGGGAGGGGGSPGNATVTLSVGLQ